MKVKISAVSYSNTLPFLHGLKYSPISSAIDLSVDIPSECARKLLQNEVDLGLVPVAVIPHLREHHIVTDYCIGANGPVDTVMLFSDVPLEEIDSIYLDYQSRTSVALVQVLASESWNISPLWLPTEKGYESLIKGGQAGVVIGDRAFELKDKFAYAYDLSEQWKELTGLPFVFACWVSNKELDAAFIADLNDAFALGVNSIDKIIANNDSTYDLSDYLINKINYKLDHSKRKALEIFLEKLTASSGVER